MGQAGSSAAGLSPKCSAVGIGQKFGDEDVVSAAGPYGRGMSRSVKGLLLRFVGQEKNGGVAWK